MRMVTRLVALLFSLSALVFWAAPAAARVRATAGFLSGITLKPVADTPISPASPDTKHGTDSRPNVEYAPRLPARVQRALLCPDLSTSLASAVMEAARVKVRLVEAGGEERVLITSAATAPAGVDLAVSKVDSADPVGVLEPLVYTITVSNNARDGATGVRVMDTLPGGVLFGSASPGCAPAGGVVTCNLGDLAGGATVQVTISVTTPHTLGTITNWVQVTAQEADPVPGNNSDSETTSVRQMPSKLVPSGVVDFALVGAKVFWHGRPVCAAGEAGQAAGYETISRVAAYGSLERALRRQSKACGEPSDVRSNIVADEHYLYWMSNSGLMRLSTKANVGDVPTLLTRCVSGAAELAHNADYVFVSPSGLTGRVWRVRKSDVSCFLLSTVAVRISRLSADDEYVYWLVGGNLWRCRATTGAVTQIGSGVTGYYPEGTKTPCPGCPTTRYVFLGKGAQVLRYNNLDGSTSGPLYTSPNPSAQIYNLTSEGSHLYLFAEHAAGPSDELVGVDLSSGTARSLHTADASSGPQAATGLKAYAGYLLWQYQGGINRLVASYADILISNVRVTGMWVTQGVQHVDYSGGGMAHQVGLIRNRRTFVRLFVRSDGPLAVSGVTAHLYGTWSGGSGGPLEPVNKVGKAITVQVNPDRNDVDSSFLFELPLDWTTQSDLVLHAQVNPYRAPPESNYGDNGAVAFLAPFLPEPRLHIIIASWSYSYQGVTYNTRWNEDLLATRSWMGRGYPVTVKSGWFSSPSDPGLFVEFWTVYDDAMGPYVFGTADFCQKNYSAATRCFCASYYANGILDWVRKEFNVSPQTYMYGMIPWPSSLPKVCGQATDATMKNSSGGAVGSISDVFASHEVGHTLARAHSFDDVLYPYPNDQIGPGDGTVEGLDRGDAFLGIPQQVYGDKTTSDLMSYNFGSMWISDHTYGCIYQWLTQGWLAGPCGEFHPHKGAACPSCAEAGQAATPPVPGDCAASPWDWLSVSGAIRPDQGKAYITFLRRLSSVAQVPALTPGNYRLQLLAGDGAV
ncbi:MAG: DUF11 domain-containing protein, partial [Chloroflexi bacterium]|nr:DUF11 domain-containing protein [Chloroflexota bacterium]